MLPTRTHNVEVDDEVFRLVQDNAEPLVDTFNSALRRLLPLKGHIEQARTAPVKATGSSGTDSMPSFPRGMPEALSQTIEVVQLVRSGTYTRTAATQFVAKRHGLFPQTVLDKYCRQLRKTASEFDRMLEEEDLGELRAVLREKFPTHADAINSMLGTNK
jgi:hypothetical protein